MRRSPPVRGSRSRRSRRLCCGDSDDGNNDNDAAAATATPTPAVTCRRFNPIGITTVAATAAAAATFLATPSPLAISCVNALAFDCVSTAHRRCVDTRFFPRARLPTSSSTTTTTTTIPKRMTLTTLWMGLGGCMNGATSGRPTSLLIDSKKEKDQWLIWNSHQRHTSLGLRPVASRSKPSLTRVSLSKNNSDDEEPSTSFDKKLTKLIDTTKSKLLNTIPAPIVELWDKILTRFLNIFPTLRTIVLSFFLGAAIAIGVIFVPVYDQIDKLTEPVTLFETILADLDQGYVDAVDTQKLFETGISAMLRSLDPYTEFESRTEAVELNESVQGRYGGVGLVISGITPKQSAAGGGGSAVGPPVLETDGAKSGGSGGGSKLLPQDALDDNVRLNQDGDMSTLRMNVNDVDNEDDDDDDEGISLEQKLAERKALAKARQQGIRVVSAFEGYAYDYGMRVGDKLTAIDGWRITPDMSVEDVRNRLRGEPGTTVAISFLRDGVEGENTVTLPRTLVKMRDVKLATLLGDPRDGIGYIQLSGFAAEAGRETRNALLALQRATEDATGGERSLQGLILDLRGNPGGLLTSAVDVASLMVPKGSDIVSARGRGFPSILYRSRVDPILDPRTKLAVIVNGQTASAAEIVSGAIQDLDVGVIVGSDRTFGKGLVQNVEDLPFNTALKFTVAKYYTPSGRCIQSTNYKEGGGLNAEDGGRYKARKVKDKDKMVFYTKNGREVKDGGGIEVDVKVEVAKASALEVTLLRSGVLADFAAEWSKKHELTNNFNVDEGTYREFQNFVMVKDREGDIKLDALYSRPMEELKKSLEQSGFKGSQKELGALRASIVRDIQRDFDKYKKDIKEDIGQSILARYLPESMLIERSIRTDDQVLAALDLLKKGDQNFDRLLARSIGPSSKPIDLDGRNGESSIQTASAMGRENAGARLKVRW